MEFEVVIERDRFLARLLHKGDTNLNLKFTPADVAWGVSDSVKVCFSAVKDLTRFLLPRKGACRHFGWDLGTCRVI